MSIRLRLPLLRNILKVATGNIKNNAVAQAAKDAHGVSLDFNLFHYYGWPRRYMELFMEIKRVKKVVMPHIKCPVVAFLSRNDEMVSLSSVKVWEKSPTASIIFLPDSTRYYYSENDRKTICEELKKFQEPAITKHLPTIFKSGKLDEDSVRSILEQAATDYGIQTKNVIVISHFKKQYHPSHLLCFKEGS